MSSKYYTPLGAAAELLAQRSHLQLQVERWWESRGWGIPPFPGIKNMAVFARHVVTARYEDLVFYLLARRAGLTPVWLSYTADKMVDVSPFKRGLLNHLVCSGRGRSGGFKTKPVRLGNVQDWKGRPLNEVRLDGGELLVDYHHRRQQEILPGAITGDVSPWLTAIGKAKDYYVAKLAVYIAHGVLFEDYHGGESGAELGGFTTTVFEPAFAEVETLFGVKPLIVAMPWRPEFAYYAADSNWREHGVIPPELL